MLRKTIIAVTSVVLAVCTGCESHAQNREAAKQKWDKTSAQIKLNLARQQIDVGDYDRAAKTIKECISADPQIPQAHLLLGKLLLAQGSAKDAVRELRLAVELDEELDEGWYWLGLYSQGQGQNPQSWQTKQTLFYYDKAMALKPANVDYIIAVAETYVAQEKPRQAVNLLEGKIASLPGEVSLKIAAAKLMCRLKRNERAIELYRQAMLMRGEDKEITESLGYCYVFDGRWDEATRIFGGLLERCAAGPKKKLYLEVMALCDMNSGQYDRAVSCYDKLSVTERDDADIWVKMGQAALGAGEVNRAFVCGKKALALRPGYADAVALMGCAQYASGDYAGAARSFKRIAADKKNSGFSWLMRARCYEQLGQTNEAERAYKKALEINPHSGLGDFLAKGKDI